MGAFRTQQPNCGNSVTSAGAVQTNSVRRCYARKYPGNAFPAETRSMSAQAMLRNARVSFTSPLLGLTMCCDQPTRPADTHSNNGRKEPHRAGEENPTYADSKDPVGEENPPQCANRTRSRSSQGSQMPSKICSKQNTHRAEHLVAENDLGVRKVCVTDRETHRRHRCRNVPEVQQPVRVP